MFKKEADLLGRSKSKIQNKDVKKLRTDISKSCRLSEEELNEFFNKKESVTQAKLANRTIIYEVNDIPMFYDKEGRGNFYPTIFLLWRFPNAVRNVIVHSPVSEFILNGADLMLPGVAYLKNLEGLTKGEKVCVRVLGNPLPFAVGDSLVSWETIATYGLKGKAVETTHMYTDCLFASATSSKRTLAPNAGFTCTRIFSLPGYVDINVNASGTDKESTHNEEGLTTADSVTKPNALDDDSSIANRVDLIDSSMQNVELSDEDVDVSAASEQQLDVEGDGCELLKDEVNISLTEVEKIEEISMDDILCRALFRCLKYVIKDHLLPLPVSSLWATALKCTIEDEPRIDLKKTKYRKVSEVLHHYTVSPRNLQSGILVITEEENVQYVNEIIRQHDCWREVALNVEDAELFRSHVRGDREGTYWNPSRKRLMKNKSADVDIRELTLSPHNGSEMTPAPVATSFNILDVDVSDTAYSDDEGDVASGNRYGNHINKTKKYQLVEAYKVPKNFLPSLFSRCRDTEFGPMLKSTEIRQAMGSYVSEFKLESTTDKSSVAIPSEGPTADLFSFCSKLSSTYVETSLTTSDQRTFEQKTSEASAVEQAEEEWHRDAWDGQEGDNSDGDDTDYNRNEKGRDLLSSTAGVLMPSVQSILQGNTQSSFAGRGIKEGVDKSEPKVAATWKPVSLPPVKYKQSSAKTNGSLTATTQAFASKPQKKAHSNSGSGTSGHQCKAVVVIIRKEDLWKAVITKLVPYHGIMPPGGELRFCVGKAPQVSVAVETRAGNKVVTRIQNLELFFMDMNQLLKDCQKKFACSVSLVDSMGNTKGGREVVIQGNFGSEAEGLLIQAYGLPKTLVDVRLAKGVKPKR